MASPKAWIHAMRLRTLPLAFSSIIAGSSVAIFHSIFNPIIFSLALFTTLCLQILSNLANDYGDFVNGVDNDERVGPERALQSGAISQAAMKGALYINVVFALVSGIALIGYSFGFENKFFILFLLLGLSAIAAAIKYTVGKKPYGYLGLGDLFVFIFFGLVGVGGSYFLFDSTLNELILLPAITIGCLSMAVLNMNNMRDRESDAKVGKITLAVRLGKKNSSVYHTILIVCALASAAFYSATTYQGILSILPLIVAIPLALNIKTVFAHNEPQSLDPELKKIALSTFAYSLLLLLAALV